MPPLMISVWDAEKRLSLATRSPRRRAIPKQDSTLHGVPHGVLKRAPRRIDTVCLVGCESRVDGEQPTKRYCFQVACSSKAFLTRAGVNGAWRNLTPVASNIAFPTAAATGAAAASPAPSGRS
jgi:hypothetical protein